MTTTFGSGFAANPQSVGYNGPAMFAPGAATAPSGTFVPGTRVQVGGHRVVIEKYLSEGGFAHVYVVRLPKPVHEKNTAVLKRVAVPDKETLANMRTEVETMQRLKGRHHIVTYIDSHASQLRGGGYEVFLLMEYCNGGGLIDFMNTRLQNRLTEPEILKIFSDVAQGVACMHYLKPPLLHRDLKVENVLISSSGSSKYYKLCDFGSAAPPRPAATSAQDGRLIEEDIQKHTTLQYRSPEMIDVYRKQPIDEKSDIWALGVLLYKLCYYKTPFEEQGQMAILNASFKYPGYPTFSDRIKKLIASMLRENPSNRPNIYQVIREVCAMRNTDIPIKDIYAGRTQSENRRNQHMPTPTPNVASPPIAGAYHAPIVEEKPSIPDIVPMRRGRPSKNETVAHGSKPSPSPLRTSASDPFVMLDAPRKAGQNEVSLDEISTRFPPLEQFSLLHESGSKFAFDHQTKPSSKDPQEINQRVTNALADEVFGNSAKPVKKQPTIAQEASKSDTREPDNNREASKAKPVAPLDVQRPSMVSTGTMTSPSPPEIHAPNPHSATRPIFKFPPSPAYRSSSQPRPSDASLTAAAKFPASATPVRPRLADIRSKSQVDTLDIPKSPASSRPSLEGQRPSGFELENNINRSKSASFRSRPVSEHLGSKMGNGHEKRVFTEHQTVHNPIGKLPPAVTGDFESDEIKKIDSNVDFLRAMEEEDPSRKKEKRSSSGSKHVKRASMPSISLSGTKNLFSGRFGEAFRRFEASTSNSGPRSPSLSPERGLRDLTPIAGSEATDGRSDDEHVLEETEDVPPEVRRELERRRLSQEEKRVADAAAAYRRRLAEGGTAGRGRPLAGEANNRATSIQNKVKSLLDESGRVSPTKGADGHGQITNAPERQSFGELGSKFSPTLNNRQTPSISQSNLRNYQSPPHTVSTPGGPLINHQTRNIAVSSPERSSSRPNAPPKPQALRSNAREEHGRSSPAKPSSVANKTLSKPERDPALQDPDDWEAKFSKKYPSLAEVEMVETHIDRGMPAGLRLKDA